MLIGGLQKTTLIDYPDKVAATIFTIGCNFRCGFCYNTEIVKGISRVIPVNEVLEFLNERKKLLDAVCISGGEPTLHLDLIPFIKKIKNLGYLVKLDTNGTRPQVLEKLIQSKLLDYVAMDIKAPWAKYGQIVSRAFDLPLIKKSVIILKRGDVAYEFRSTVLPAMHSADDIFQMAKQIEGADKYILQAFRPAQKLVNQKFCEEQSYGKKQLTEIAAGINNLFKSCVVR